MSLVFNLYFNIQSLGQKMFDGERQFPFMLQNLQTKRV